MMVPTFGDGAFGPDYKLGIQNVLPTSQHQIVRLHSCGSISTLYSLKLFVWFFFSVILRVISHPIWIAILVKILIGKIPFFESIIIGKFRVFVLQLMHSHWRFHAKKALVRSHRSCVCMCSSATIQFHHLIRN